jgi:hypothetical protein
LTQRSGIPRLKLKGFELDDEHCRALLATEDAREDFEITLDSCRLTEAGESVLLDGIRRNQGPTSLHGCRCNTQPLAEALNRNTHIKRFQCRSDDGITDEDVLVLLWALAGNLDIEELGPQGMKITNEGWSIMCQSLANHPAIEHLNLDYTASRDESKSTHCSWYSLHADDLSKKDPPYAVPGGDAKGEPYCKGD